MTLRPNAHLYDSYHAYKRGLTRSIRSITIGRFVAFFVEYPDVDDTPKDKRQRFWIGKVTKLLTDRSVAVRYYHTSCSRDGNYSKATYKAWSGQNGVMTVSSDIIIDVFDRLTDTGLIPSAHRNFILDTAKKGIQLLDEERPVSLEPDNDTDYSVSDVDDTPTQQKTVTKKKRGQGRTKSKSSRNSMSKSSGKSKSNSNRKLKPKSKSKSKRKKSQSKKSSAVQTPQSRRITRQQGQSNVKTPTSMASNSDSDSPWVNTDDDSESASDDIKPSKTRKRRKRNT